MNKFDDLYYHLVGEAKKPITSKLKPGDKIKNVNPDCEHYGSKGVVKKVEDLPETDGKDVESKHNMPGKVVEYEVTNKKSGRYKPKDKIKKTGEQLKKA